ncbi:VanZ family protein [Arthrobacter sp. RCC_34]|uniref:VanZ family protein n=1 Tax=Arthrobacter sp. RCC_34 TaxID=3239230 RepID=UPI0035260443
MTRGWLVTARTVFAVYIVALLLVVLLPADDARHVTGFVSVIADFLSTVGIPRQPAEVTVEFLSNIVLFGPWGFLLRLLTRPALPSWAVALSGAVLSTGIELLQLIIPGRVTALSDVIANTLGTLAGVLLLKVVLAITSRLSARGAV